MISVKLDVFGHCICIQLQNPAGAVIAGVMLNFDVALVRCVENVG